MEPLSLIQNVVIWAIPVLLAITLHEAAHAFMANRCGDTTAKSLGRLSLNPLRHIDPVGTVIMPLLIGLLSSFHFIFGYAKPVPIRPAYFKNPRRDSALVALAGPFSNFMMAFFWAFLFKVATLSDPGNSKALLFLLLTSQAGISINLVLAALNILPIPPLDGSRIVASFLKPKAAMKYARIEPFGFLILILLLISGLLSFLLSPIMNWALMLIKLLFNL